MLVSLLMHSVSLSRKLRNKYNIIRTLPFLIFVWRNLTPRFVLLPDWRIENIKHFISSSGVEPTIACAYSRTLVRHGLRHDRPHFYKILLRYSFNSYLFFFIFTFKNKTDYRICNVKPEYYAHNVSQFVERNNTQI